MATIAEDYRRAADRMARVVGHVRLAVLELNEAAEIANDHMLWIDGAIKQVTNLLGECEAKRAVYEKKSACYAERTADHD